MTIRTRLTLWFAGALSITIIAFSLLVWRDFADQLRASLDDALRVHAEDVRSALAVDAETQIEAVDPERPGIVTAIVRTDGSVVRAGAGFPIGVVNLSLGPSTQQLGEPAVTWMFDVADAGQGREVVTASRTDEIDRSLQHLGEALIVLGTGAVIASVAGGWALAGRFLAPIRRLNDEAAEIGSHDVGRRMSVSGHDEIGRLGHTLNGFLARVQAATERERLLIASAAHDIRTPVAALRGELELGMGSTDEREIKQSLRSAHGDAVRLSELADGLLALAEVETDRDTDPPRLVSLAAFVGQVLHDVEWDAQTRGVRVQTAVPDVMVPIAQLRVGRALTNVVRNAIRYGPRDETVEVWAALRDAAGHEPRVSRAPADDPRRLRFRGPRPGTGYA